MVETTQSREPAQTLKVSLALASQAFQRDVAKALGRHHMLAKVFSMGRDVEVLEPDESGELRLCRRYSHYKLANRLLWAAWRRLPFSDRARHFPVVVATGYVDWLFSRTMPASDIYHGWTGMCRAGLQAAKCHNTITMIENPSMHPRHWQAAGLRECETWGVPRHQSRSLLPEALVRRMEAEFEIGDFIVVPSNVAAKSFEQAGLGHKALVMHAAADARFLAPLKPFEQRRTFRVCYAGRVELAKGVPYLLEAWKKLSLKNAELILVGEVSPDMATVISRYGSNSVQFEGYVPAERLSELYRSADLFAFPSVNEGLARVLLESMASGLPVVATDCSGAADCVTSGVDGTVIPPRDSDALASALLWHYENRDATRAMGSAARMKVESYFTIEHYVQRMLCTYARLAGSRYAAEGSR